MARRKRPQPVRKSRANKSRDSESQVDLQSAIAWHHDGQLERAERAYQQMLASDARQAVVHHLLGRLYFQTNRQQPAIEALRHALALHGDYPEALLDLSNMLSEQGKPDQAKECLLKLIQLKPQDALALCNLASLHTAADELEEAVKRYCEVIRHEPTHIAAHRSLASLLRRLGRHAEAQELLAAWLKLEPDNPIPQHLLAAYVGDEPPARAADEYIKQVFDQFAATFESDLGRLNYCGPQLIQDALRREFPNATMFDCVLDAGCGTGLCGPVLREFARQLIGVDLSPKMLQVAEQRQLYDALMEAELCAYLNTQPAKFDLIACADTFGYFGDLILPFTAAYHALRDNGRLLVTVELGDVSEETGYRLRNSGRYAHHRNYITQCCEAAGFTIRDRIEETMRHEAEQAVRAVVLTGVANKAN